MSLPVISSRSSKRGFALVITLAALVLTNVMLLALFSSALLNRQTTYASTKVATADHRARASAGIIFG